MNVAMALLRPLYANIFAALSADVLTPDRRVFIKDAAGTYLYGNAIFAHDAGMTETQVLGRTDEELCWASHAERCREHDLRVMKAGDEPIQLEYISRKKGPPLQVQIKKIPLFDERMATFGIIGSYVPAAPKAKRRECADCTDETVRLLNLSLSLLSPIQMATYEEQAEAMRESRGADAEQQELL